MATYCPQGHVNPPYAPTCRVCQATIARQDPQRAPATAARPAAAADR